MKYKKRKYKEYPQIYEKVFTSEECLKTLIPDRCSTDYPGGFEPYAEKFREFFKDFTKLFWLKMAEYYWLQVRFIYEGIRKKTHLRMGIRTDSAYSTFIKNFVGSNYQIFVSLIFFRTVSTYFREIYGLEATKWESPYEFPEKYQFPWKNITLAHMFLVYQMDERLELLKIADERKMSFYEFLDFIINYINCVNDEEGKQVFTLFRPLSRIGDYYVQYHFREGAKSGFGKNCKSDKAIRRKKTYEYKKRETKIKTGDTGGEQLQQVSSKYNSADVVVKSNEDNSGS
jgi:hypothetical protein